MLTKNFLHEELFLRKSVSTVDGYKPKSHFLDSFNVNHQE